MKKISNAKKLIVGLTTAALAACLVAGCSPSGNSDGNGGTEGGATGDLAAMYPEHAQLSDGPDTLAGFHMALGQDCESCHPGDLSEQITIAGIEGEPEVSSLFFTDDQQTCLSSECHVSVEALAERTADLGEYNPHASIHGTIEYCNDCHKGHSPQIDTCGECHPNGGQEMLY